MNIFLLDKRPKVAAMYHNDKHVIKMCLETAQLLCTTLREKGYDKPWMYKSTHKNHPCTIWAREKDIHFDWLCQLGIALCKEYTYRYGKIHKCQDIISKCFDYSKETGMPKTWAVAMTDECKISDDPIECYREYYKVDKANLASWDGKVNSRETPYWYEVYPTKTQSSLF